MTLSMAGSWREQFSHPVTYREAETIFTVNTAASVRSSARIFFSRVNFVCWLLFSVCSILVLPQWHVKDPGHSAKSVGGRLQLNTHTPSTRWSRSGLTMLLCRHSVGTHKENEVTRNSSGNTQPQSSQLAQPLWTDPGLKNGTSMRKLISTLKKKKAQAGNKLSNPLPKSLNARKKLPPPPPV